MLRTVFIFLLILTTFNVSSDWSAVDAAKLVAAARDQIGVTMTYDPGYQTLKYPMGDVAAKQVCARMWWFERSALVVALIYKKTFMKI